MPPAVRRGSAAPPSDGTSESRVLARLRNDRASKRRSGPQSSAGAGGGIGDEGDWFIPALTLISVVGFAGLYGCEMLRLYSRGDLYLPWDR
jgi:hypothetical protein